MSKQKILGAIFDSKKMHIYDVKTKGRHPVHVVEGGEYITEEDFDNGEGDCGWFWLNQKEYDYYKSQIKEIEVDCYE